MLPVRQEQVDHGEQRIDVRPLQPSSFQVVKASGEIERKCRSLVAGAEPGHAMQQR